MIWQTEVNVQISFSFLLIYEKLKKKIMIDIHTAAYYFDALNMLFYFQIYMYFEWNLILLY